MTLHMETLFSINSIVHNSINQAISYQSPISTRSRLAKENWCDVGRNQVCNLFLVMMTSNRVRNKNNRWKIVY